MPHIVSIQQLQDVSSDWWGRDVEVMDDGGVNFAVIGGSVERQMPFYKGVWGVDVTVLME
jgi:hypothetical protein